MQLHGGRRRASGPPPTGDGRRPEVPGSGGYRDGPIDVDLAGTGTGSGAGAAGATVCVENRGDRRVYLGGQTVALAIPPRACPGRLQGEPLTAVAHGAVLARRRGVLLGGRRPRARPLGLTTALGAVYPMARAGADSRAGRRAVALAARGRADRSRAGRRVGGGSGLGAHDSGVPRSRRAAAPRLRAVPRRDRQASAPRPGAVFSPEEGAMFRASGSTTSSATRPAGHPGRQTTTERSTRAGRGARPRARRRLHQHDEQPAALLRAWRRSRQAGRLRRLPRRAARHAAALCRSWPV